MRISKFCRFFLIFAGCLNIYGQQSREISSEEFTKARTAAYEKINQYNRRVTGKTEAFSMTDGKTQESATFLEERILPDKRRMIITETTGKTTKTTEIIKIGNYEYRRNDNGDWTKNELTGSGAGSGSGMGAGNGGGEIKYKYALTETTFNKEEVSLFEQYMTIDQTDDTRFAHEKMWINKAGQLLKRDFKSGYEKSGKIVKHNVVDYQYDPKDLKIEAPIP